MSIVYTRYIQVYSIRGKSCICTSTIYIVSRGQTTKFLQGVIACSISARKKGSGMLGYGLQAKLVLDTYTRFCR